MGNCGLTVLILCVVVLLCSNGADATDKTIVFYMHDIVTGNGQTAKPVVVPTGTTGNLGFGAMTVIDDALTESADPSSNVVGRGQGMYVTAARDISNFLLLFTAVLTAPEYNNSTINFQGADRFTQTQRDVSVVGGTGMFKFAQGYANMETSSFSGMNVVLKFTVFLRYNNTASPTATAGNTDNTLGTSDSKTYTPSMFSIYSIICLVQVLLCIDFGLGPI